MATRPAMKTAAPDHDAAAAAFGRYARRPLAQRKANTFSKITHCAMPKVECMMLCSTLPTLKTRAGISGLSDHLSQCSVTCQNEV
jgi:hypothetical protein